MGPEEEQVLRMRLDGVRHGFAHLVVRAVPLEVELEALVSRVHPVIERHLDQLVHLPATMNGPIQLKTDQQCNTMLPTLAVMLSPMSSRNLPASVHTKTKDSTTKVSEQQEYILQSYASILCSRIEL